MRLMMSFLACLALAVAVISTSVFSDKYFRARPVEYVLDPAGSLTPEDVMHQQLSTTDKTLSPLAKFIWLKMPVPSKIQEWTGGTVLFTGSNEGMVTMHAYQVGEKVRDIGFCDVRLDLPSCTVPTLQYAFAVEPKLDSAKPEWLLIKIETGSSGINNEFYFMERGYFNKITVFIVLFLGAGIGVGVLALCITLLFYFAVRDISSLYYGLFHLAVMFSIILSRGIWDLFKPELSWLPAAQLLLPSQAVPVILELLFLKTFFEMNRRFRFLNLMFWGFIAVLTVLTLLSFNETTASFAWTILAPIIYASQILAAGSLAYLILSRQKRAGLVGAAWSIGIGFMILWATYLNGLMEGNWVFGYFLIAGYILQTLMLNGAVFQRLNSITKQMNVSKAKEEERHVIKTLLRSLSHDLSGTTQLIQTSVELCEMTSDPAVKQSNMERIAMAARTQAEIITSAKSGFFAKGGKVLNSRPVVLKECVDRVVDTYRSHCEKKQIQLLVELERPDLKVMVEPKSLTHQVLGNILGNAIKFTPVGKRIFIRARNRDDDHVELLIKDEGVGIPLDILSKVLDETQEVSRRGTENEMGTGWGLLIAHDFTVSFGATFDIESPVEGGTEVTLRMLRAT